jgi:hypothetical protein
MAWLTILLGLYLFWVASTLYSLFRNYLSARKTGLPLVILPFNHYNPVWMILSVPIIRPLAEKLLPGWMYEPIDLSTYGWEFRLGYSIFEKYGPAFILVSGSANELSVIGELCDLPKYMLGDRMPAWTSWRAIHFYCPLLRQP